MRKISISAAILLLSTSAVFAESGSIKEAFSKGTTSGDLTIYSESTDVSNNGTDSGFTAGSVGISYMTDTFKGFSAGVTFRGNGAITEKEDGDYDGTMASGSELAEAYVKYANDKGFISVGRQAIDLEWLGDYNESVVAGVTAIEDTTIVLGYTNKQSVVGYDEVSSEFTEIGTDGAYVLDVKYAGIENTELNGYYYDVPDLASYYGAKASYDADMFGVTAHYAASSEDVSTTENGNILHLEGRLNIEGVSLAAGYISTDKDGNIGSMSSAGDNINPLDDGTSVYADDAQTMYGSITYTIADVGLTAVYGTTEYGTTDDKDKELNLMVDYSFSDELSANLTYVNYDFEGSTTSDYNKMYANVTYSF